MANKKHEVKQIVNDNAKIQHNQAYNPPKKSMVVRVLILVVAALMFIGAIAIPFMSVFTFKY